MSKPMSKPMSSQTPPVDFAVSQKIIHWLMAFLIMVDLIVAQKFGGAMELADRAQSRSDHASVGLVVLGLFLLRLYLRRRHGAPALPEGMSHWQAMLAKLTHIGFYLLIGLLLLSGLATGLEADSPIRPFGVFTFGNGMNDGFFALNRQIHHAATLMLGALIALHILAGLWHLFILRDGVMRRMARFWASEK